VDVNPDWPSQFLKDAAAFVIRQANVAAILHLEGVELRFLAFPEGEGLGVAAFRLTREDRAIQERLFSVEELRDSRSLAERVEDWVRGLPVAE
jgi:hypothetical protein